MVRFKNRHILVEFLQPSSLSSTFTTTTTTAGVPHPASHKANALIDNDDDGDEDMDGKGGVGGIEGEGDEDEEMLGPQIPFMLPLPSGQGNDRVGVGLNLGDEGGSVIYRAVRASIQDVYGDEGWGRVASSFKVIYHSPLTTLTMIRISRQHYRLVWSALTLLTSIQGQPVLPRVISVSGTIKKLQNTAIVYHRTVMARYMAVTLEGQSNVDALSKVEKRKQLENTWNKERQHIDSLDD